MPNGVFIKHLNLALQLDRHRMAKTLFGRLRLDLLPTFADVIFLNVRTLFALEADTDVVLKALFNVVRAARIDGQVVWEFWFVLGHGESLIYVEREPL